MNISFQPQQAVKPAQYSPAQQGVQRAQYPIAQQAAQQAQYAVAQQQTQQGFVAQKPMQLIQQLLQRLGLQAVPAQNSNPTAQTQQGVPAAAPSQSKTVFGSVFNLGEKLLTTGKAKFNDYANVAFDLAKGFLGNSSWLENSTSVLGDVARSAFEADSWKDGLKNAGKVVFDWGKNLIGGLF